MALTAQQNGTTVGGNPNQIRASWFNDYKDLLTGAMNDQPVTLNYRPGSGTTPTLTLQCLQIYEVRVKKQCTNDDLSEAEVIRHARW